MLTAQQINEFTRRAKLAGLTDEQIRQEIEKKAMELSGATSPLAQTSISNIPKTTSTVQSNQTTSTQFSDFGSLEDTSSSGGFLSNFISSLTKPLIEYGKYVGEAAYQAGRFAFSPTFRKAVLGEKLTPEEAEKLSKEKSTLFYSEEEAQSKLSDRGKIVSTGLKTTGRAMAEVGSFAVPFGRGANLATKVFIPGAVSGALFEASKEEATPESVLEAGATGALTAGAIEGVSGMLSWVRGKGGELVRQSERLAEGTRKIKVKPSVYGASQERAINQTLDKYGFKGSAQRQYEMLEPTFNAIEEKIQNIIKDNPNLSVSVDEIKNAFLVNLKSSLRTRDLTQKQAIVEINGYLNDLYRAAKEQMGEEVGEGIVKAGSKKIDIGTLREMKKVLNQDYASVFKKLENGSSLNPREKVIAAAWDSLDEAIKNVSPELKGLLVDESNLYRAAQPLARARLNPPTFRFAGTSVPASVTQKLRDVGQAVLKKLGLGVEKIPETNALQKSTIEKLAALTPAALKQQGLTDEEIKQVEDLKQSLQTQTPTNQLTELGLNGQQQTIQDIKQPVTPSPLNPFGGLTKRQVLALALSNGASAKDLDEVGKIYDMLAPDSGVVSEENMKIADSLRAEYFKRTTENKWIDIVNAYNKVMNTTDTAAGDVSLIYGFIKLLDPNSAVLQGEMANVENSAGIPDKIRVQYNKALKGERLTPRQREAYRREAARIFQVHQQRQAPIDAYYQGLARRYGIDPSLIGVGLYQPRLQQP